MKNPLENNRFCTALIILCNAMMIGLIYLASRLMGIQVTKTLFYYLFPIIILGNIMVRLVIKSASKKLAKNYKYIIIGLIVLIVPMSLLF
jgi:DMSO reductase anchor subunit